MKCLRDAGWYFKTKGKRNEIYRLKGDTQRLSVPTNKRLPESAVRMILRQARLDDEQIDAFLKDCDIVGPPGR